MISYFDLRKQLPDSVWRILRIILYTYRYCKWITYGKKVPPPHIVKIKIIKQVASKNNIKTLVETGTYLGDTLDALRNDFYKLYSIELDKNLFLNAEKRFKKLENISILYGDSAKVLPKLVKKLPSKVLFWLDAHYSGKGTSKSGNITPILKELKIIFRTNKKNWVVLVDDARLFTGKSGYPKLSYAKKYIFKKFKNLIITKDRDMLIIRNKSLE